MRGPVFLVDFLPLTTQLATIWAVVDPIGHVPLFLAATAHLNSAERRRAAIIGVCFAFGLLVCFGLLGQIILDAMGISLLSFQIAGGTILFLFAVTMVLGTPSEQASTPDSALSVAVYPVATPIIAGPGSLLTIVLLMDNQKALPGHQVVTLLALAIICAILLAAFLMSGLIQRVIGAGGANLLRRVMGLLLAALAVNMVLGALAIWLRLPPI